MVFLMSGFVDQLAGDVLRDQGKAQGLTTEILDLRFDIVHVVGVFEAELPAKLQRFFMILHKLDPTKDDNAFDVQRPLALLAEALIHDAEGCFFMPQHGVDLVAGFAAVEVYAAILGTIPVIDGHTVGIIVIAQQRQNAPGCGLKQGDAFFIG